MYSYFIYFIITFILAYILTPLVIRLAKKNAWAMPAPRQRDVHRDRIPRIGGVVLFVVFWLVVAVFLILNPEKFKFVDHKILGIDQNLLGVFLGSLILFLVGIWDDFRGIKPGYKLLWQVVAACLVVIFGVKIWWFSNPLGGLNLILGNWTYIIVPLWIILIVNVLNWLDGLDGLADGISSITLIVLAILSASPLVNQPATALLCAILAGASLGLLPFNFNPAKIFLGDSGSMFLGFMIAIAAIISGGKVATVVLILGIPILDALWVIFRRIFSGKSPFSADQLHLHHRFLHTGLNQKQIVLILYLLCAMFGVVALQNTTSGKVVASIWLVVIMVIIGVTLVIIKARKKKNI